jgi:RecA-family ATPase
MERWQAPKVQFYIEDLLFPKAKMFLFGRFQSWKSMVAEDTAFRLAEGKDWYGLKTTKARVYYLQIEMPQSELQKRTLKMAKGNSYQPGDNLHLCTESYIKLDKPFGIGMLEKEIERTMPNVIIADPLYAIMSGRLTDEYDVRQFLDRMNMMTDKYNVAVIIVHHDRKWVIQDGTIVDTGADNMLGSILLNSWCDASVETQTTGLDGEVIMKIHKAKYFEKAAKEFRIMIDRNTLQIKRLGAGTLADT